MFLPGPHTRALPGGSHWWHGLSEPTQASVLGMLPGQLSSRLCASVSLSLTAAAYTYSWGKRTVFELRLPQETHGGGAQLAGATPAGAHTGQPVVALARTRPFHAPRGTT